VHNPSSQSFIDWIDVVSKKGGISFPIFPPHFPSFTYPSSPTPPPYSSFFLVLSFSSRPSPSPYLPLLLLLTHLGLLYFLTSFLISFPLLFSFFLPPSSHISLLFIPPSPLPPLYFSFYIPFLVIKSHPSRRLSKFVNPVCFEVASLL
jgi:hypothetical protein